MSVATVTQSLIRAGMPAKEAALVAAASVTQDHQLAVKAGAVAVATNLVPPGFYVQRAVKVTDWFAKVGTAPTGATMIVLVKKNGTTCATLTIAISGTAAADTTDVSLAVGDLLTFDVTQVGSTVAGSDLRVGWKGELV